MLLLFEILHNTAMKARKQHNRWCYMTGNISV